MLMSLSDMYANLCMGVKRLVAYQDAKPDKSYLDAQH